jgi:hypothetical protein
MPEARRALANRFDWYSHVTWRCKEPDIRQSGLECRSPLEARAPRLIVDILGERAHTIACLHPFGARLPLFPERGINPLRLAVHRDDLPSQIGLDWSYDTVFDLADVLHDENPQRDPVEIFVEVVDRRGSVACYEPIPVAALRYHVEGLPTDDPSEWPKLIN